MITLQGAGAIVRRDDGMVLLIRIERRGMVRWELPTAIHRDGESLLLTAIRCVEEDSGFRIRVRIRRPVCIGLNCSKKLEHSFFAMFYECDGDESDVQSRDLPQEQSELPSSVRQVTRGSCFVDWRTLPPHEVHPQHLAILRHWLTERPLGLFYVETDGDLEHEAYLADSQAVAAAAPTSPAAPARASVDTAGAVDFVIVTVREDEYRAVLRFFPPMFEVGGRRTYSICEFGTIDGDRYRAAILRTPEQGHASAQAATSDAITDFDPSWIVLVGIAGAVPEFEFTLGDVVVGTRYHDFALSAALPGGRTERDMHGGPAHLAVQDLASRLAALEARLGDWNDARRLGERPPVVIDGEHVVGDATWTRKVHDALQHHFGDPVSAARAPRATAAAIASGNVLVKDPELLRRWLAGARSIKAVEMELPGVYEAARSIHGDKPVLAVRGISDVVGFRRDPRWTAYACVSAASFARALLGTRPIRPRGTDLRGV
jgi:nucleoside phosphorylase/ADP-ribose pyrophosphatase YjhB (NUDIX family)